MKHIITAPAPTVYQIQSLSAFNMGYKKNGNGSFTASMDFESAEAAKEYLISRAKKYNDEDPEGTEARLSTMLSDIKHGVLTLDAVTAYIEEID